MVNPASTMEGQPPAAGGYLPVEAAPKARPLAHLGRCAAVLCAAMVLATVGLAILTMVGLHHLFPEDGVEVTDDLDEAVDETVELTPTEQFADMLDKVNHERQKHGLSDLCYNQKLIDAAEAHSEDMAVHNKASHTGSDGSLPADRVRKAGYHWRRVSENVASGQGSVESVMRSWMNSTGHRANILRRGISHFGFGRKDNYWTQLFASPMGPESCMLAGGGEDGHGGQCRDVVPKGERKWHDSDGAGYHCDWYAEGTRCQDHGMKFKNFGYTASQACCTCGGGLNGCLDKTVAGGREWYDSDGRHCDWYGSKDGYCAKHGSSHRNHGMVANEACCACGGGTNMADTPAPTPAKPPCSTPPTGACCNRRCRKHSDCAGPDLFCCPFHNRCMDRDTRSTRGPNCNACRR